MKKVLVMVLAIGLVATAADAATVGMRWKGSPDQAAQLNKGSDVITIEIYADLLAGESLTGFASAILASPSDPGLTMASSAVLPPAWFDNSVTGALDDPATNILWFSNDVDAATGPGQVIIGEVTIHALASVPEGFYDLTFLKPFAGTSFLGLAGADYTWDARYNTSYAGYVAFGDWGNPGWGTKETKGHQPTANPLILEVVPEPASLALLALGSVAMLRRRR